jgi:thioester reductase-like protein
MSCELLTGATGFLGSYLLRDALVAGREVAVLVRPGRHASAQKRMEAVLDGFRHVMPNALPMPTVIEGDLRRPDLGVDAPTRAWITRHCDRVIHCAASLDFRFRAGEPYLSNVDGTRFVLELCRETGIRDFHLVSTAYVCGKREGVVREDELESGQAFSNDYERSKFLGEILVRQAPFLDRWTVYRPSVIVGDSKTGFAVTNDGLYAVLRLASLAAGRSVEAILEGLGISAYERVNLVPVDWTSAVITHLVDRRDAASTTYHLTNPSPTKASELVRSARHLIAEARPAPARAFDGLLDVYGPYLKHHCTFDSSNTERDAAALVCPRIEGEVLERLVSFFSTHGLERVRGERTRPELALTVAGEGGGTFDLSSPTTARDIAAEDGDDARVRAHCTTGTMEQLIGAELTVEQAVYAGVMALEGEPSSMEHATFLLESFLAAARETAAAVSAGDPA